MGVYLYSYIHALDVDMVKKLLLAGADPNPERDSNCYLFALLHEYYANKTLKGSVVIEVIELLLQFGANPNRVWGCNLRTYDICDVPAIGQLLEKYGADPTPREAI